MAINKTGISIIAILVSVLIAGGGWVFHSMAQNDERHDEEIRELYKQKANYDVVKELLELQGKNFDRVYEEIKEIRETQIELLKEKRDSNG